MALLWAIRLMIGFFCVSTFSETMAKDASLEEIIEVYRASDAAKENNLFCKGHCHLAKLSHRLTSIDIKNSGARFLIDILRSFPAVFFIEDAYGHPQIGLYGASGNARVQVIVDGQRVNDPYDGSAFLYIPVETIDYVDVYYGPGGAWFGDGSLIATVAVFRKSLPNLLSFAFYESSNSLSGGFLASSKKPLFGLGLNASFVANNLGLYKVKEYRGFYDDILSMRVHGFFDTKFSSASRAHFSGSSSLSFHEAEYSDIHGISSSTFIEHHLIWHSDLHLIRKIASKNQLDLFFASSFFNNSANASFPNISMSNFLKEDIVGFVQKNSTLRLELGLKSQSKPWPGHELFFGMGAQLQGLFKKFPDFYLKGQNDLEAKTRLPLSKFTKCQLFSQDSNVFSACNAHIYLFAQEEWQIKPPFSIVVGGRALLPVENISEMATEFLPTLGMVVSPHKNWRLKLVFQSSLRAPTFNEIASKPGEAIFKKDPKLLSVLSLDYEKSRSLDASLWFGDVLGNMEIRSDLSIQLSKIDKAIARDSDGKLSNNHEIDIVGIRLNSDAQFTGGHSVGMGIAYTLPYKKEFDEMGFAKCRAGIYNMFSNKPSCLLDEAIPLLMTHIVINFDFLSVGNLGLSAYFYKFVTNSLGSNQNFAVADLSYYTKPIWRYMVYFITLKNVLGDLFMPKLKGPDYYSGPSLRGGSTIFMGFNINL